MSDPELVPKLREIVGLYGNPPAHAIVLSVDAKSQIQALDRTGSPNGPARVAPPFALRRLGRDAMFFRVYRPSTYGKRRRSPRGALWELGRLLLDIAGLADIRLD